MAVGERTGAEGVRGAGDVVVRGDVSEKVVEGRASGKTRLISACLSGLIGGEWRSGRGPRSLREESEDASILDESLRTGDLPRHEVSASRTFATSNKRAALSLPPVAKYLPSGDQDKPQICCEWATTLASWTTRPALSGGCGGELTSGHSIE